MLLLAQRVHVAGVTGEQQQFQNVQGTLAGTAAVAGHEFVLGTPRIRLSIQEIATV